MRKAKRYIPLLITFALVSLIALQAKWLFFVYEYKKQELADNTREAVFEATGRLKKNEDSKFILNNIDSLMEKDSLSTMVKEDLQFVVTNIKNKLKIDSIDLDTKSDRQIRIISDTSATTTIVKIDPGKKQKIIIRSESHVKGNPKKKAKELQELFLKMAISAEEAQKNIDERVDTLVLKKLLKDELLKRGIDLVPDYGITYMPANNKPGSIAPHVVFNTPQYVKILPSMVTAELFPGDVIGGMLFLKLGYTQSTTNFVIKQMAGLLALSLFITLLIAFVMILTFKRMLSQEKLLQIKNDFINNMTHELKTPIATISLAIDSINNPQVKTDEEKFKNYTRILKEENNKLNNHVERVLQMAMLDKGELQLNKQNLDLVAITKEAIDTFKLQAQEKNAKINFVPTLSEIKIAADKFHLKNAICNLIDNALKYSHQNCEINISLEKTQNNVVLKIKDKGIGIDASLHDKIFEKFYRVQGGNLHDTKGFGLGLSYVRSIIQAHNGTITVQSEKNKGSEFIITLKHAD